MNDVKPVAGCPESTVNARAAVRFGRQVRRGRLGTLGLMGGDIDQTLADDDDDRVRPVTERQRSNRSSAG
jgi:hypothetical protein